MKRKVNSRSKFRILLGTGLFITLLLLIESNYASEIRAADSGYTNNPNTADFERSNNNFLANCRYGITSAESTAHLISTTGAGVFYKFNQPNWYGPLPENGAELMHMIKTRQNKRSGVYLSGWYTDGVKLNQELIDYILDDLGAVWIIGNEIERGPNPGETWSARTGDMYPEVYAEAYHDIYHFIKAVDPTARVANAGLIQITPMRLQYLNKMWDAYLSKYGEKMPVDVWTIHTYVMPELTPDGQPNNIASVALKTDLSLGKRASGGDGSKCTDDMVYCFAEHDDISILKDQIVAMRTWMKERGEQNKPLIVTEYGTLYHYIVKEDGSCGGKRDEFGKCFVPERVTKFMLDSFEFFANEGRDPNLGLPSDNDRLVQQWIWYGAWEWDIGSSNLLKHWSSTELTMMGKAFRDHVQAKSVNVNLAVDEVKSVVTDYYDDDTAKANISVSIRNNGNKTVVRPFRVTFYSDEALTKPIGSVTISESIRGCATNVYTAEIEWDNLPKGTHPFWVKIDSDNNINENKGDNIGSGTVEATGPVYDLQVDVISDGIGHGGVVTKNPNEAAYTEGSVVKLTAVPFAGWTFEGWSGAVVGNNPNAQITISADTFVQATFKQEHYQLDINLVGNGEVNITPQPVKDFYLYGDEITLRAVPEEGWRFVGWSGFKERDTPGISVTFESDVELTATFEKFLDDVKGSIYMPIMTRTK